MNNRLNGRKKRLSGCRANNQGSTLLTVVICLTFIGILASLVISLTMTNLQMKMIESSHKKNFYSSEKVMDRIRVAVQETAAEAVKYVYENEVLNDYAFYLSKTEEERNELIQKAVAAQLIKTLGDTTGYRTDDEILASLGITMKTDYFMDNGYLTASENSMITWPVMVYRSSGTDTEVRLNNIKIQFQQGDYRTAIASDIVVSMPRFSFGGSSTDEELLMTQPFADYTLIADDAILSDQNSGTNNINGNIYAGAGGITVNGQLTGAHTLNINCDRVVTRGDITVNDTAALNIGMTAAPVIWADNLVTGTSTDYPSGFHRTTDLNINGICVIKDDLTLNGQNSRVAFLGGAYLGYTGLHTKDGSAMMINGSGSSLDLAGLSDLVLAGRAHVAVEEAGLDRDTDILTGESVSFKSNQRAYLIPGKFITNILHNPVTEEDYTDSDLGAPEIEINDTSEPVKYLDYLADTPYKIAAKQSGTATLRYYYLNFADGKKADEYMKRYYSLYPERLNNMAPFSLGTVTLPVRGALRTAGNAMSCDASGKVQLSDGLSSKDIYADDASLDNAIASFRLDIPVYHATPLQDKTVGELGGMYSQITHLLTLDNALDFREEDEVAASMLKAGGVSHIIDDNMELSRNTAFTGEAYKKYRGDIIIQNTNPMNQYFYVIDGNVTIASGASLQGVLIATGSITVEDNADVKGLIISTGEMGIGTVSIGNSVTVDGRLVTTGDILLGQNDTFTTSSTMKDYLKDIFQKEGMIMNQIFKNARLTIDFGMNSAAADTVDLSRMISYENWRTLE